MKKAKEGVGSQPTRNPNAWDLAHGTYIAGRAALDGVAIVAAGIERLWGCGRLRLIVPREIREKFDRQRYLLAAAVHNGDLYSVQTESQRMINAWRALDTLARATGQAWIDPCVWEVATSDGKVIAIVQDAADAHAVIAAGRRVIVYTLDEVARMLESFPGVMSAKAIWPGTRVEQIRKTIPDPLDRIPAATNLDDPLDDLFKGNA